MKCLILTIVLLLSSSIPAQKSSQKITANDHYNYISINNIRMWIANNGDGSHDPQTDGSGFYWPGGENAEKSAIFEDGFVWGGKINGEIYFNGNTHRQGLQAGKILANGLADDPSLEKYRVYKIRKDWKELPIALRESYRKDYDEWPVEDVAPYYDFNNDGQFSKTIDQPLFEGDEVLWYVANDLEPTRTTFTFGTLPIGLEFQTTVYAFKNAGVLNDVVFKKYRIINKGNNVVDSMYFGYWSDPDLGDANDDYIGCDTILNLGYCYNADGEDGDGAGNTYGNQPPAVGYRLVQGPIIESLGTDSARFDGRWINGFKNTDMSSFTFQVNPPIGPVPDPGANEWYNYLTGNVLDGTPFIDPNTGIATQFCLSGDPVVGIGWYEGTGWPEGLPPGDRRMLMGFGAITFSPGDTQEVVIAIIMARGSDNIQSVAELKKKAVTLQKFYDLYQPELVNIKYEVPKPDYYYLGQNYPNPFNPATTIKYELPVSGLVILKVFDILGNEIETLINEEQSAGEYEVEFESDGLPSGIYIYQISSREFSRTKKMILLK